MIVEGPPSHTMVKSGSRAPNVDQRQSTHAITAIPWWEARFENVRKMATGLEKPQNVYDTSTIDSLPMNSNKHEH